MAGNAPGREQVTFFIFLFLVSVGFIGVICWQLITGLRTPQDRPTHWSSPVRPKKPGKLRR